MRWSLLEILWWFPCDNSSLHPLLKLLNQTHQPSALHLLKLTVLHSSVNSPQLHHHNLPNARELTELSSLLPFRCESHSALLLDSVVASHSSLADQVPSPIPDEQGKPKEMETATFALSATCSLGVKRTTRSYRTKS